MRPNARSTFGFLILAQAAHSVEEFVGRLWETFPPARLLTGLLSDDRRLAFLILNVMLVAFGAWCYFWPVSRGWRSARAIALGWVAVELINGFGHPLWSLYLGSYTPGVATSLILLPLALWLLKQVAKGELA